MEAKSKRALIALLALATAFCFLPPSAQAIAPGWSYRVLRSPHFELIYREDQKPLAKRYILAAEQAHELLIPLFKEGPSKTIILLQDDTDSSNGEANFLPYPHIVVYPVLPQTGDSIDEYGDWPLEMMIHEYTHILNMYPAHSFYVPLSWIFGSVVRPNAVLPTWYLEGLAVNTESVLSDHGRLRSSETLASARALVLENALDKEDLARANQGNLSTWPFGARPYLYGGWWWESVTSEKGLPTIERWNQNYSRRLPFFLNGPMIEATGKDPGEWLDFTHSRLPTRAQKEIDAIKATHPPVAQPVAAEKGEQNVFALSPSGTRLIYWISTKEGGSQAKVKVRAEPTQEFKGLPGLLLFKTVGTSHVRWIDEDRVVFDQLDYRAPYVTFSDLYLYNFKTNQVERLTKGARAQEPSPSPTGEDIVFIQNDAGRNHLALYNMASKQIRPLVNGNLTQRLSGPEFFTRDQIVFSVRQLNGSEMLHVYDLQTRKASRWTEKLKAAQGLRRIASGFLVTDASQGIRNVYWIHEGQVDAVSNTFTDIADADYDPLRKELITSELTAGGRQLRAIPFATYQPPTIAPSSLPPPPKAVTESVSIKEESYQPIYYLLPRYWIPFIYQVERGLVFQGVTGNSDPAGRNQYSLVGSFDTVTHKPSYGANYVNSSTPVDIGMGYAKSETYLGASGVTLESQSAALDFSPTSWPFRDREQKWSLGGLWLETRSVVRSYRRIGPTLFYQFSGLQDPLNRWHGLHLELAHQEFLKQEGYLAYGRSTVNVANLVQLGGGHKLLLQTRASFAPRQPMARVPVLGDPNIGGNYAVNLTNSNFLLRGYDSGEFIGRKVLNANLEYSLPAVPVEKGYGTFPLYLQNLEWVLFGDTMAVDGWAVDAQLGGYVPRNLEQFASGAGTELRLNATVAYHMPLLATIGLYYGMESRFGGGFSPFFTISLGTLGGLQDKTP